MVQKREQQQDHLRESDGADIQNNRIYVPRTHSILADERIKRRLGGQVFTSGA
jgi:hypothetical protein